MIKSTFEQKNPQRKKNRIFLYVIEIYTLPGMLISDVKQDWNKTKVELIDDTGEWFIFPLSIR